MRTCLFAYARARVTGTLVLFIDVSSSNLLSSSFLLEHLDFKLSLADFTAQPTILCNDTISDISVSTETLKYIHVEKDTGSR